MAMVYQKGTVYEKGTRVKKWYGKFRVYMRDREGKEVTRTKRVILGLKSKLRKHEAEEKLEEIVQRENGIGKNGAVSSPKSDDSVTLDWFVTERYLPMRRGQWRPATKDKTEYEIKKYLVSRLKDTPLRKIGPFEIQMLLNDLAREFSESIVRHAYVNVRSIMRMAQKLKFIAENPGEDTKMPETRAVSRPIMTPEQIVKLIDSIGDPHDLCLMSIGLFCATRTSETFGLQWKSYFGDKLIIQGTAYEGKLFPGKVKTNASWNAVPIPEDIRPIMEAWKQACPDTSPEALMFPTSGRQGDVPRHAKNFLKWRIHPIADKLGIPRKLVTFQVMRRTVGTDLQKHGTMKDAQQILRHANIQTTGNVYMQQIPTSVMEAINSRTRAILTTRRQVATENSNAMGSNGLQLENGISVNA
jgi:integrase